MVTFPLAWLYNSCRDYIRDTVLMSYTLFGTLVRLQGQCSKCTSVSYMQYVV